MKLRLVLGALVAFLTACQSNLSSTAPPITTSFIQAGVRQNVDPQTLADGRKVFLNRCILCHALPEVARFDAPRLNRIVGRMSGRANLSPEQHEALLKYLLTVRSQDL